VNNGKPEPVCRVFFPSGHFSGSDSMSGILPFADVYHPIWSPVANEIHAAIWDRVGLEVVQGFVQEWASNWNAKANDAKAKLQEPWQALNPALPLPPSPHSPRTLAEKWATLAALHDVYDLTGDTVLPWPLPEDDHDLAALTEWMHGKGGAYCLLMRKAIELRDSDTEVIRRWLTDVSRDTPPKVTKPNDISQQLNHIEAAVATITNVDGTSQRSPNQTTHEQKVERILNRDDEDVELPFGYDPNVPPKVVEWANDSEESSNAIEVPQDPSLREILTAGLSDREMNMLAKLIELEQQYWEQPDSKSNPLWQKRYDDNRYQEKRAAKDKRNLAVIARQIFRAEKDRVQNLNVQ
jgi:hypothetical protein